MKTMWENSTKSFTHKEKSKCLNLHYRMNKASTIIIFSDLWAKTITRWFITNFFFARWFWKPPNYRVPSLTQKLWFYTTSNPKLNAESTVYHDTFKILIHRDLQSVTISMQDIRAVSILTHIFRTSIFTSLFEWKN